MAALQRWRRAYGALKDSTTVGLANLNSDYKDLDVAIVKATNHVECPPKERHLRKILLATSAARPREDAVYCIRALAKRLAKTRNWVVALKVLIVIQRILREGYPIFREDLLSISQSGHILQLSNFKDDSSPIAWDCSAWVRTYALYLEEKLECFRVLKYDVETERLMRPTDVPEKGYSRTRTLESKDLLNQIPALQQLLHRLVGCRPEGASANNRVIQYALALVLKESFKIYCAINDGIINLVDKFFEMPRHEASKALEIYKKAGQQAGILSDFYEECRSIESAHNFQFPSLKEPPRSFLSTMEEYINEAPRVLPVSPEPLELPERLLLTYKQKDVPDLIEEAEELQTAVDETKIAPVEDAEMAYSIIKPDDVDLLGLGDFDVGTSTMEGIDALALAIVPSDTGASGHVTAVQENGSDPTGWELALVTASSNLSTVQDDLARGLDKFALDSLYNEATRGQQQSSYAAPLQHNPFLSPDPYATSNLMAPPPSAEMAAIAHQQQFQSVPMAMQTNPFGPMFLPQPHLMMTGGASNPFGDMGFGPLAGNHPHQQRNPFAGTGLL